MPLKYILSASLIAISPVINASELINLNCTVDPMISFENAKEEAYRNGLVQQVETLKSKGVIDSSMSVDDYLKSKIVMHADSYILKNTVLEVDEYVNDADGYIKWKPGKVEIGSTGQLSITHTINRVTLDYTLRVSGERQPWSNNSTVQYSGKCKAKKVERSF